MGKRTRKYEVQFNACLLSLGPPPQHPSNHKSLAMLRPIQEYKQEVKDWWRAWHGQVDTPPGDKSCNRFSKRYFAWLRNKGMRI